MTGFEYETGGGEGKFRVLGERETMNERGESRVERGDSGADEVLVSRYGGGRVASFEKGMNTIVARRG